MWEILSHFVEGRKLPRIPAIHTAVWKIVSKDLRLSSFAALNIPVGKLRS